MGIFKAFQRANEVTEKSKRDVAKGRSKGKDELSQKRQQKQGGKK